MTWSTCDNVDEFLKKLGPVLVAKESQHNLTWRAIQRAQKAVPGSHHESFLTYDEGAEWSAHAFTENNK